MQCTGFLEVQYYLLDVQQGVAQGYSLSPILAFWNSHVLVWN